MSHPIVEEIRKAQNWEGVGPFGFVYRIRAASRVEAIAIRKSIPALSPSDVTELVEVAEDYIDPFTRALVCTCVKVKFGDTWLNITETDDGEGLPFDEVQSSAYWLVQKVNEVSGYASAGADHARRILRE